MLLIVLIVICLVFAFLGLKKGLYVMFATMFNLLFAVFISILSTMKLLSYEPQYEQNANYAALGVFLLFFLIFGLLQFFSWFYFLRNREAYFPGFIDRVGGFLTGGVCGYILSTLILLIICILPSSKEGKMDWLSTRDNMLAKSVPGVTKACNFLAWYSLECFDGDSEKAIDELLNIGESRENGVILYYVPENAPSKSSMNQLPPEQ